MASKTTKNGTPEAIAEQSAEALKKQRTHVVQINDTLRSIAAKYLGSTTRADEIARLNRLATNILPVGKTLKIPD